MAICVSHRCYFFSFPLHIHLRPCLFLPVHVHSKSFDVHSNSFFPLFLITYVLQLLFIGVVTRDTWLALFIGNTMYLIAASFYTYITFLGYSGRRERMICGGHARR